MGNGRKNPLCGNGGGRRVCCLLSSVELVFASKLSLSED